MHLTVKHPIETRGRVGPKVYNFGGRDREGGSSAVAIPTVCRLQPLMEETSHGTTNAYPTRKAYDSQSSRPRGSRALCPNHKAYGIKDEAAQKILEEGLRSLQIARECAAEIKLQGRIVWDGRDDAGRGIGKQKLNPLCNLERDSRAAFLGALRLLNLECPKNLMTKRQTW